MIKTSELMPGNVIRCAGIEYQICSTEKSSYYSGVKFKGEIIVSEKKGCHSRGTVDLWFSCDTWIEIVS